MQSRDRLLPAFLPAPGTRASQSMQFGCGRYHDDLHVSLFALSHLLARPVNSLIAGGRLLLGGVPRRIDSGKHPAKAAAGPHARRSESLGTFFGDQSPRPGQLRPDCLGRTLLERAHVRQGANSQPSDRNLTVGVPLDTISAFRPAWVARPPLNPTICNGQAKCQATGPSSTAPRGRSQHSSMQ